MCLNLELKDYYCYPVVVCVTSATFCNKIHDRNLFLFCLFIYFCPMDLPSVKLLCLEQEDRSLEDHTRDFLHLANQTYYPDSCLCTFYFVGLNNSTKAKLSGKGPRGSFAAFVEWVLENNGLYFSVCPADEDISSPTPKPASRHPAAWSKCLSPLQTESPSLPRHVSQHIKPRLSRSSPRNQSLKICLTRCVSRPHRVSLWQSM